MNILVIGGGGREHALAWTLSRERGVTIISATHDHKMLAVSDRIELGVFAGADVLELGIPFSDPLADGPTIQKSSFDVIQRGVDLRWSLELLRAFRRAVISNDNMGGQVQGTHAFRYDIVPLAGDVVRRHIAERQPGLQDHPHR